MPPISIPLTKGTKTDGNADFRDLLPVNAIYTPKPEAPFITMTPGITKYAETYGADRGSIYFATDQMEGHFRISGDRLIEIDKEGVVHDRSGEVRISGDDQVVMVYSIKNLVITADKKQWLYNRDDGLRQNTEEDLGIPLDCAWLNNKLYTISFDEKATKNIYIVQHEVGQDDVIDAIDYGVADISPDPINGIGRITGNRLAVFNRHSIEFFDDTGRGKFTLQREETRAVDGGLIATHAKCEFANTWALIGGRRNEGLNIHLLGDGVLRPIGTAEIQAILEEYSADEFESVSMESRSERAHSFLIVHLPRHTLMFDGSTNSWCTLKSGLGHDVYRAINGMFDPRIKKWVYGDKTDNLLGYLDRSVFSQYDEDQECILYTPMTNMNNALVHQLDLVTVSGRHPQGTHIKSYLSASQEGLVYGNELPLEISDGMQFNRVFRWYSLGMIDGLISFKLRVVTGYPLSFGSELSLRV